MAIPLTGSPPPAEQRGDRLTGNDYNFASSLGNWTNSGGTLTRDTTWVIGAFSAGTLKHNTTAASQYVTVPVNGSFKANQNYYAVLVIGFEDTSNAWSGDISLGVQGTDAGSKSFTFTMDGDYPWTGTIGEYIVVGSHWKPTANRTGVTLRVTRTAASGTYNMHIYSARVFPSAASPIVQPLPGTSAQNRYALPFFSSDTHINPHNNNGGLTFWNDGDLYLDTPRLQVGLSLAELAGGSDSQTFGTYVESAAGDLSFTGYEKYVGEDYLGEYTGEKDATTIQTYMDGAYNHEHEDSSATTGYKFRAADSTGFGTDGVAWPAKGMLPAYDSDPAGGVERQAYWNTVTKRVRIHNGTSWGDQIAAGGIPIDWQGAWDIGTAYAADDGVDHEGSSYVATASTTGDEPPASPWQLVASVGTDGTDGAGVPTGGTTDQILAKASGTDFDTAWVDAPTGGGSGFTVSRSFVEFAYDCHYDTTQTWPGNVSSGGAVSGTGANVSSGEPGDSRHIGLIQLGAGTTTTGRAALVGDAVFLGGSTATYGSVFQIRVLSDGTNTFVVRAGWNDSNTGDGTDAVMFRYTHSVNSGKWEAVCRSNGTETAADTGVTATASTTHLANMHAFEIVVNGAATSVEFYIDGTLTNTVTTNIPSGAGRDTTMYPLGINASAGTSSTARILIIDAYWYRYAFTTPR